MIFESEPWKSEISRWAEQFASINSKPLPLEKGVPFEAEQALFYSAFVARKLIENRKLTDKIGQTKLKVSVHEASLDELSKRAYPNSQYFALGRDFIENSSHEITLLGQNLLGEIIHSFLLLWSSDEAGKLNGFFLASYKTHKKRALWVSLKTYTEFLAVIAADVVTDSSWRFDPETGQTVITNT